MRLKMPPCCTTIKAIRYWWTLTLNMIRYQSWWCPEMGPFSALLSLWDGNQPIKTLRPRRNEQHFADDIFKRIFFNENVWILIKISLKFVPKCPIYNIPALVQIMAWRRPGDKPLFEPMVVSLPTHICVTRPQWVNNWFPQKGPVMQSFCVALLLVWISCCTDFLLTGDLTSMMHC